MPENRITSHPILEIPNQNPRILLEGSTLQAKAWETIVSALMAHGVDIFGYHPKDGSQAFLRKWTMFTVHGIGRWKTYQILHDKSTTRDESHAIRWLTRPF